MHTSSQIFQEAGLKPTQSRLEVTGVLAQSEYPMTHQDILKELPESFDRVTLYRVLDWLLTNGVIHRIAGEDRTWRFHINNSDLTNKQTTRYNSTPTTSKSNKLNQHSHAHFQCENCGKMFCLNDVHPKLTNDIPPDFVVDSIEINIKGKCVNCAKPLEPLVNPDHR
ncbi:MAG: Fur family transcriptional regulator [Methylotenera sp.]|uniref:Fur family transcriptional regulator n=1 Tax=Methylotenera sp. TaxID=2051956 RepID=UPI002488A2BF|nr:Fur family transcriptional regulator [Methylotenera sp.]MDI1310194.1 Fur family transcriptional regulator [Methylotenera sp.]